MPATALSCRCRLHGVIGIDDVFAFAGRFNATCTPSVQSANGAAGGMAIWKDL